MENDTGNDTVNDTGMDTGIDSGRKAGKSAAKKTDRNARRETSVEGKTSLLNEWSLFWDSLTGERPQIDEGLDHQQLQAMSLNQTQDLIRVLSQDRRKMNQKIESINKEIGLNSSKLESVRLVGAEEDSILKRINELNDQGQKLSLELAVLDEKLRRARDFERGLVTFHLE
jgi:hypothetical protein